jgi:hypothetical protein
LSTGENEEQESFSSLDRQLTDGSLRVYTELDEISSQKNRKIIRTIIKINLILKEVFKT